jgi:hypothetical protein
VDQLKKALEVREQIEKLEQELSSILSDTPVTTVAADTSIAAVQAAPTAKGKKGRRIMTDEWKAKIAAAQARRWAKVRAEKAAKLSPVKPLFQTFVEKAAPGRKVMSSETKAKIGAAIRARHAAKARVGRKF